MPDHDRVPQQIGDYRLLELLGEGGMGVVYLAEQQAPIHRRVAIKLIKRGMDTNHVLARFEAERQALAILDHPGIARVLDAGSTGDGRPFFAMEYVPGLPITDYCDRRRLGLQARLELVMAVADAVQHAHQKGIIHRDLKPTNVLVREVDGRPVPKIIDFGVAKAVDQRLTERTLFTELGILVGTPEYMSPEQADPTALGVDTRTDVYSLGVLLYELIVGLLPFDAGSLRRAGLLEIQRIIRETDPPKPSTRFAGAGDTSFELARQRGTNPGAWGRGLRGELDWITMRCLEKDPARRYPAASDLAADLRRHLAGVPVDAAPPSAAYRLQRLLRRHRVPLSIAAGVFVALAAALAVTLREYWRAEALYLEAERSEARANDSAQDASRRRADAEAAQAQLAIKAEEVERSLRSVTGLRLLAEGANLLGEDPTLALLLAIEAARLHPGLEANRALLAALRVVAVRDTWALSPFVPTFLHGGPRGRVAQLLSDGTFEVWNVVARERELAVDLSEFLTERSAPRARGRGAAAVDLHAAMLNAMTESFHREWDERRHALALDTGIVLVDAGRRPAARAVTAAPLSFLVPTRGDPLTFVAEGSLWELSRDYTIARRIGPLPSLAFGSVWSPSARALLTAAPTPRVLALAAIVDVDAADHGTVLLDPSGSRCVVVAAERPKSIALYAVDWAGRSTRKVAELDGAADTAAWLAGPRLVFLTEQRLVRVVDTEGQPVHSGTRPTDFVLPCTDSQHLVLGERGVVRLLSAVTFDEVGSWASPVAAPRVAYVDAASGTLDLVGASGTVDRFRRGACGVALQEPNGWLDPEQVLVPSLYESDALIAQLLVRAIRQVGSKAAEAFADISRELEHAAPSTGSRPPSWYSDPPPSTGALWDTGCGTRLSTARGDQQSGGWARLASGLLCLRETGRDRRDRCVARLWSVASGEALLDVDVAAVPAIGGYGIEPLLTVHAPDRCCTLVAGAASRSWELVEFDPASPAAARVLAELTRPLRSLAYSADGQRLLLVDHEGLPGVVDLRAARPEPAPLPNAANRPYRRGWHAPRSDAMVLLDAGGRLEIRTPDGATVVHGDGQAPGEAIASTFADNGDQLAIAYASGRVRVVDLATGRDRSRMSLFGGTRPVGVAFSADGSRLAVAASDRVVRVWQTADGVQTHAFDHESRALDCAFSADGATLVTRTSGRWHFWPLDLLAAARDAAPRPLTSEERAAFGLRDRR